MQTVHLFTPGKKIGNYRILRLLEKGGQAGVYLAEDLFLKRRVALKIFPTEKSGENQELIQEAQVIARLDHPNIVRIYYLGCHSKFAYMATEYIEDGNIAQKIKKDGPLEPKKALELLQGAVTGLIYAHENGIIHHDLKPHNFLLGKQGQIKICDFGLATYSQHTVHQSRGPNQPVGTPQFMAPEVWRGAAPAVGSDIYSLGACLFFLLTGHAPFREKSHSALRQAHLEKEVRFPEDMPSPLKGFLTLCMHKDIARRPASALAFKKECQTILSQLESGDSERSSFPSSPTVLEKPSFDHLTKSISFFSDNATQLKETLLGNNSLVIFCGEDEELLELVVNHLFASNPKGLIRIVDHIAQDRTDKVMAHLAEELDITSSQIKDLPAALIKRLSLREPKNGKLILHVHARDELSGRDISQFINFAHLAKEHHFGLLISCNIQMAHFIKSRGEIDCISDLIQQVFLSTPTTATTNEILELFTREMTLSRLRWTNYALLLAGHFLGTKRACHLRLAENTISIALFSKMKVITTWCVKGALAHRFRIAEPEDLLPEWRHRPQQWPDPEMRAFIERIRNP